MIRVFVLYYLSLKSTHGYEIQRCLHDSGIDQWLTVNSGSIYYALSKLEKEGLIYVRRDNNAGARQRKVYCITENGRTALKKEFASELEKPISDAGSPKFLAELMLGALPKADVAEALGVCIRSLEKDKALWEKWRAVKLNSDASRLLRLTFDMTIESLASQKAWHEELLNGLDGYFEQSERKKALILDFQPDAPDSDSQNGETGRLAQLKYIRALMSSDPERAGAELERIIAECEKEV